MSTPAAGFEPVAEVAADDRARIAFGRAGVRPQRPLLGLHPLYWRNPAHPLASIPKRELLVWEDDALRESLLLGLADASQGRVSERDDLLDDNAGL